MEKKIISCFLIFLFFAVHFILLDTPELGAQTYPDHTVGILMKDERSNEGYTLFAPSNNTTTYLINNDGFLVHSWNSSLRPGLGVYLLENGSLLRAANVNNSTFMGGGGGGGRVQLIDWNGTVTWNFLYSSSTYCQHHDVEMLPNGNILIIAWELKTAQEASNAGRAASATVWPDSILEIQPNGTTGGTIVWEWHVWDHFVQDQFPSRANYGIVSEHPELIDINFVTITDMNHTNAIDYNPGFDQILISVRYFSEIWIIDHSTTTTQAAGHTGGRYGKGGDILYRWGNPQAYDAGTSSDRKFYTQHDAQWIEDGLPGAGHILVFNNGENRPGGNYSTVDEIIPPVDANGNYQTPNPGSAFGPSSQVWIYQADNPRDFNSQFISGVQRLPNGNTLVCEGVTGTFFEVTSNSDEVWEYINPVNAQGPATQGNSPPTGNDVFKIRRYAPEYPAFSGRDMTPGDTVELPAPGSTPAPTPVGTVTPTPTPVTNLGDVNGDGSMDIVDALLVAQYYVGLAPANFNAYSADVNCDGTIDIVDALLIAQFYVGLISQFC